MVWSHAQYGCITGGTDEFRMQCMFPDTLRIQYVCIRTAIRMSNFLEGTWRRRRSFTGCCEKTTPTHGSNTTPSTLTPVSYLSQWKRQTACQTSLFKLLSIRMYMFSCLHSLVQKMVNFDKCIYTTRWCRRVLLSAKESYGGLCDCFISFSQVSMCLMFDHASRIPTR